jgi:hypothetical protein
MAEKSFQNNTPNHIDMITNSVKLSQNFVVDG